jgi:hypothetical protein
MIFASVIDIKENLSSFKIADQFDKELTIKNSTKKLIVAFSKEKATQIKDFLYANPNYLESQNAIYISDVSSAPSFVTSMFMIPKFKDYPFSMGLIRDEDIAKRFPKKEGLITIIHLNDTVVTKIEYRKSLP